MHTLRSDMRGGAHPNLTSHRIPSQAAGALKQHEPIGVPERDKTPVSERARSPPIQRKSTERSARSEQVQTPMTERAKTAEKARTLERAKTPDQGKALGAQTSQPPAPDCMIVPGVSTPLL